jgi:hypothetical protein
MAVTESARQKVQGSLFENVRAVTVRRAVSVSTAKVVVRLLMWQR